MESVILQSPPVLILYGIALVLNLFDRFLPKSRGVLTLVSAAVCVAATACALLAGAAMFECAAAVLVFLLVNMGVKE